MRWKINMGLFKITDYNTGQTHIRFDLNIIWNVCCTIFRYPWQFSLARILQIIKHTVQSMNYSETGYCLKGWLSFLFCWSPICRNGSTGSYRHTMPNLVWYIMIVHYQQQQSTLQSNTQNHLCDRKAASIRYSNDPFCYLLLLTSISPA